MFRSPSLFGAASLFGVLFALGCSDHSALAPDPPTTAASSTTSSGSGGSGAGGAGGDDGAGGGVVEPSGPTQLTIVNGVNDYDAIRLCFVPYPDGDGSEVSPWPAGAQGLTFATGIPVDPIKDAIPPDTDINTFVIGGNLAQIAGMTCAQVFDLAEGASPPVVVAPLGVLPKSTFTSDKSLLLAATGCLGGPGHSDMSENLGCGSSYKPETPNPGFVALSMSRIKTDGKVALQIVHASAALPTVDFHIKTGAVEPKDFIVARKLTLGAIGPKPPFDQLSASAFGVIKAAQVITTAVNDTYPTSSTPLSSILMKGSIPESDFIDGAGFVFVAVGGHPGAAAAPWWHGFTYAVVRGDP